MFSRLVAIVIFAILLAPSSAFAPRSKAKTSLVVRTGKTPFVSSIVMKMSEEPEAAPKEGEGAKGRGGDLYDDEVPVQKDPLSASMRERLMREASTGLDADQKQTNVILYISIAVAILVLLGGQGILY